MITTIAAPAISSDEALRIARMDGEMKYHNLSQHRVEATLHDDGWHVEYSPAAKTSHGGGPHYVIDAATGEIRWKRYYQ